jgi:peptidylprolyl isomerase
MNHFRNLFTVLIITLFIFISCKKEDTGFANEQAALKTYIAENNITTTPTASGLYYIETLEGTGVRATAGKNVRVHYDGYLLDGTLFDTSHDDNKPIAFVLGTGRVIAGWDEGIALMKEDGKARLIILSNLAYGSGGTGSTIPPYSTLIFDVELLDVF